MEARLNAAEIACVKRLAELYETGEFHNGVSFQDDPKTSLGLPNEKWEQVLSTLEECGLIESVTHGAGVRFFRFRISARALQAARQIREMEQAKPQRNIVDEINQTAKGNRVLAWVIIGFIVLTAAITFANQLLELLKKFGVTFK